MEKPAWVGGAGECFSVMRDELLNGRRIAAFFPAQNQSGRLNDEVVLCASLPFGILAHASFLAIPLTVPIGTIRVKMQHSRIMKGRKRANIKSLRLQSVTSRGEHGLSVAGQCCSQTDNRVRSIKQFPGGLEQA
jgi:hypothetical protein